MNKRQENIWFPAKKYGWGWGFPVTWQGWLFLIIWAAAVFAGIAYVQSQPLPGYVFHVFLLVMVCVLLAVCFAKGAKPKWYWGT